MRRDCLVPRVPVDLDASPSDLLRGLRGHERVVALVGEGWSSALVAWEPTRTLTTDDDPFAAVDADPGTWIGYWGYPLLHRLEEVPDPAPTSQLRCQPMPPHVLGRYDRVLRFVDGRWWAHTDDRRVDEGSLARWAASATSPPAAEAYSLGALRPERTAEEHQDAVRRALQHLHDGDIFQVNLTTALRGVLDGDPLDLFCDSVERLAPAYAAYVGWEGGAVVSLSPELFLRRSGRDVTTSPIKGTAPRDADAERDRQLADDLLVSAKDRAENVMIVDLMRNDLARVCEPGSVHASDVRAEPHAVWHLVADVRGRTEAGTSDGDLLRATFPPGSVTGAPKVRAMQVAAELEASARQVYTGAVGLVSPDLVELNVAIRTFEVSGPSVTLGVGGGIVVDSDPTAEWEECLLKARSLFTKPVEHVATPSRRSQDPVRRPAQSLTHPARVLFLDNYDSFVHNLVDDARRLGAQATVVRNDMLEVDELVAEFVDEGFTHLVVSPGPGAPAAAGVSVSLIRRLGPTTPVLGVCLGHQAIVEAYGGTVVHAPKVVHGKASWVEHDGSGIWAGLPSPLLLGRYHSLTAATLPEELVVNATSDGLVMGVRHRVHPVHGIQGHPESVLTEHGEQLLRAFLACTVLGDSGDL